MIAVASVARQWRAALLVLLLVALLFFVAVLKERTSSEKSLLAGIPTEEITGGGMTIVRAQLEPGTPVTRDAAVRQAVRTYPGGVPREVVLVYLKTAGDPNTRVAWAVHFDPSTVTGTPPMGPGAPPGPYEAIYAFVFIDARTGEFIFGGDRARPLSASPVNEP